MPAGLGSRPTFSCCHLGGLHSAILWSVAAYRAGAPPNEMLKPTAGERGSGQQQRSRRHAGHRSHRPDAANAALETTAADGVARSSAEIEHQDRVEVSRPGHETIDREAG